MPRRGFYMIEKASQTRKRSPEPTPTTTASTSCRHLFPNFRAGGALVCQRVADCQIGLRKKLPNFFGESRGHVLVIFRMPTRDIGPRDPDFGAERFNV